MTEITNTHNVYCLPGSAASVIPTIGVVVVEFTAKQVEAAQQHIAAGLVLDEMPDEARHALLNHLLTKPNGKGKPGKRVKPLPEVADNAPIDAQDTLFREAEAQTV